MDSRSRPEPGPPDDEDEDGAGARVAGRPIPGQAPGTGSAAAGSRPSAAGDDGVPARLSRRTAAGAGILGLLIVLITVTGLFWPGWFIRPVGLVTGVLLIVALTAAAVALLRRSAAWTTLTATPVASETRCVHAVVGDPRPLHRSGGAVLRRRSPAVVVPIRSEGAPWANGAALLVHGRADGAVLCAGDELIARWESPRGPYLLERCRDGAVFAAGRSTIGAW